MVQKCYIVVCLVLCGMFGVARAGESPRANLFPADTTRIDTARLLSDQPVKSPMGAVLRSAVLPGLGQLYNHAYWKAALAASVNGYLVFKIIKNQRKFNETKNTDFRNTRNTYYWYFGVTYLLTLADAYVDAYLYDFDKAMDIALIPSPDSPGSMFLSVRVNF